MNLSFVKNVKIGFAFSILILAITSFMAWFSIKDLIKRSLWVEHTHVTLGKLESLMSYSKDAETSLRGYLLTYDREFLELYYGSEDKVLAIYKDLDSLMVDNDVQQRRLALLKKMIDKRFLMLRNSLDLQEHNRSREAKSLAAMKQGKRYMDMMRNIVRIMENEEERLLDARIKSARFSSFLTPIVIIVASLLAITFAVLSFIRVMRDIRKRVKAEKELEFANLALEESYEELAVREEQLREMNLELEQRVEKKAIDLIESERRYRFMAESIPAIVWTAEPDGSIDYFSKKWTDFTGLTVKESCGWAWNKIVHPDDLPPIMTSWKQAIQSGNQYKKEFRIKGKDGTYRWLLTRAVPLKNKEQEILKWFGTAVDIEDEKMASERLRISEEKYRLLSESIPQLVWTTDASGKMDYVNQNWLNYTGQSREEALSSGLYQALHPDDRERVLEEWMSAVEKGDLYNVEYKLKNHQGIYRWFLGKAKPIKNDHGIVVKWFGTTTDIDDQKASQQILKKKNEELIRINTDLDNFIYTASHDLKAPISNIEGLLYTLKDSMEAEVIDKHDLNLIASMMKTSTEKFKHAIQDLTEITKLQKTDNRDIQKVNFYYVLEEVKESIQDLIRISQAKIRTDFTQAEEVIFSCKNLRSILYNLLSNAIKFRDPGRQAEILIKSEKSGSYIVLTVKDNGLGIPPQHLDKVFSMFKRVHDHVEGTGIGLYIVKRIVDNAGGHIELRSQLGKGSVFKVYFCNDN